MDGRSGYFIRQSFSSDSLSELTQNQKYLSKIKQYKRHKHQDDESWNGFLIWKAYLSQEGYEMSVMNMK